MTKNQDRYAEMYRSFLLYREFCVSYRERTFLVGPVDVGDGRTETERGLCTRGIGRFLRDKPKKGERIVEIVCTEETLYIEVESRCVHNRLRLLKPLKNKEKKKIKKVEKRC